MVIFSLLNVSHFLIGEFNLIVFVIIINLTGGLPSMGSHRHDWSDLAAAAAAAVLIKPPSYILYLLWFFVLYFVFYYYFLILYFFRHIKNVLCAKSLQSCPTLCNVMDCSLSSSSVRWILQAKILEWVVMPSSKVSSQPGIKPTSLTSPALAGGLLATSTT